MSFLFTNGNIYSAYSDTGPGDILVAPLATVSTNGTNLAALKLAAGAWDVTVNGKVASSTGHAINLSDIGAYVSEVKIGPVAEISGGTARSGINAAHATNINNSGTITGGAAGITESGDGDFFIANTGVITGGRYGIHVSFSGTHLIFNNGKISGGDFAILGENGAEKVTNFGTLEGNVNLGDGDDIFNNFIREGTVTENGIVTGLIHLGRGDDIFNGGANREVVKDGDGKDVISFAGGNDHWFGYLAGGDDGADVIDGGAGIDTYDASQSGVIGVAINLGEARSSFSGETATSLITPGRSETIRNFENAYGTNGGDFLIGGKGANSLFGGAGDDVLIGGAGKDVLDGGDGNDIFQIAGSEGVGDSFKGGAGTDKIQVLGTGAVTLSGFNAKSASIEQWAGKGKGVLGTSAADKFDFSGLSSVSKLGPVDGKNGNDVITGSKAADDLRGGAGNDALKGVAGNDKLDGGKGNDKLDGGAGNDVLTGGLGKDVLTGGLGKDRFDFNSIKESVKGGNRDQIKDFKRGQDKIDLRDIDANTRKDGNQKFTFIGDDKFSGKAGELRFKSDIVQGDVNGDGKADFEIHVNVNNLAQADFVL